MSGQSLGFADSGFVDAIRNIVVRVTVAHYNNTGEPLPLPEGVKLVQDKIMSLQRDGDPLTGEHWAYSMESSMKELTIRRRMNEAASVKFYAKRGELPPLKREYRQWQGRLESLYSPRA